MIIMLSSTLCDEVGYIPLADVGVVSERAEQATLEITTNLAFSDWTQLFTSARLCKAMVERVTDRAIS
ncbi:MAG: ATP-binding protein [Deltaproteobacteria bacterium]|nr:ATP-binding protein [Deltaproteobacteria bacterium]